MADARIHNPMVEALIDDLARGRLGDVDAVQRHLVLVRTEIAENAALLVEAAAQLAQARRRLAAAAADAGVSPRAPPESEEELVLLLAVDDPEVATRAADYSEAAARAERIRRHELLLFDALGFLLVARAFCFAS